MSETTYQAFGDAIAANEARLQEVGFHWDADNRRLVDPETGEVATLERVVDEATAKAAAFRIWSTEASIGVLKAQKKAIERQIKQREARLSMWRSLYEDDMVAVANGLMAKAKTKIQSIAIGYSIVGWRTKGRSITVADPASAMLFATAKAPESMKVTIDFDLMSPERRQGLAQIIASTAILEPDSVNVDVRAAKIPEGLIPDLPAEAFTVDPGGGAAWYVKGAKATGGDQ